MPPTTTAHAEESPTAVVERLFAAMRRADTAAARATFGGRARVIPVAPGGSVEASGQGLSVDQFVAFVGHNPPDSWRERLWNATERTSGPLADVWFDYDVYRGNQFDHCGGESVQLQKTAEGWRITSMTFTSATQGCTAHGQPM